MRIAVLHRADVLLGVRYLGMAFRGPIHPHPSVYLRLRPASLDPLGVKLGPHKDKQGHVPDDAPCLHEADGIAEGKIGAGGDEGLAHIVQEDEQHEQVAGREQPWAVPVGDGEVEDGQAEGDQDAVGDDQGLDGAQGELVGKVGAVDGADVVAEVGGQRVGQVQGHGESERPP